MDKLKTYSNINKRFNAKGVIDYRIVLFLVIYACIIYQILDSFNVSIIKIIYILLLSLIPLMGIYFTLSKEENILQVLVNIIKYLLKPKTYVYYYENKEPDEKKYKFKYLKYSCKNK